MKNLANHLRKRHHAKRRLAKRCLMQWKVAKVKAISDHLAKTWPHKMP
jgi:hypothetical protein